MKSYFATIGLESEKLVLHCFADSCILYRVLYIALCCTALKCTAVNYTALPCFELDCPGGFISSLTGSLAGLWGVNRHSTDSSSSNFPFLPSICPVKCGLVDIGTGPIQDL